MGRLEAASVAHGEAVRGVGHEEGWVTGVEVGVRVAMLERAQAGAVSVVVQGGEQGLVFVFVQQTSEVVLQVAGLERAGMEETAKILVGRGQFLVVLFMLGDTAAASWLNCV